MKSVDYFLALNYRTSVFRDEDGDFVAEVEDLPGCASHGATPDQAFENLETAKRLWMESRLASGLEIPEPRREEFSGKLLLRMPRSLHRRLAREARCEGTSLNQYVVSLLSESCGRQEELAITLRTGQLLGGTNVMRPAGGFQLLSAALLQTSLASYGEEGASPQLGIRPAGKAKLLDVGKLPSL